MHMTDTLRRPAFMTDPTHLSALAGQKYVVLRVGGDVERLFEETQRRLRERLAGLPVGFPNTGHVTLKGYPRGTDHDAVTRVLDRWSSEMPPLSIETERLSHFGPPHQVVILQVKKTEALSRAYCRVAELSNQAGLPLLPQGGRPVEEWVFHISMAYCKALPEQEWARVVELVAGMSVPPARYVAEDAELVCFDDDGEHQAIYRLGDPTRA